MTRRELFALTLAAWPLRAKKKDAPVFLSLGEARPVLDDFAGELPGGLRGAVTEVSWREWETAHDREIRARLRQGDADSIVNLVLFGNSFTARPRVTGTESEAEGKLILARVHDFAQAVIHPGTNERLQFAAEWLGERDPKRISATLLENILRVRKEQRAYAETIAEAKRKEDAAGLFVKRSSLYRERGLSLDTSFRPNFAIERSLAEMKAAGVLREVRRAAVIGPGLDFTDKRGGYDFYPVQTLQPFAVIDSLRRLRLAAASGPAVEVFDLSERVLSHVRRVAGEARAGAPYTVQVPLDEGVRWLPATVAYWQGFGSEIGTQTAALDPPAGVGVRMRAVRIRPAAVELLHPAGLDIVTQHLPLTEERRFDLVIATNVLVYYSQFEQALGLRNVAGMLAKAGVLLSNNILPEVKGGEMLPVGGTSVAYSGDPDDGDHVIWYKHA